MTQGHGVVFPAGTGAPKPHEKRSTTDAAKRILIAALGAADPAHAEALAAQSPRKWRYGYQTHFVRICEAMA